MFSKRKIRRVWSGTLAAVGTVALAATFSVTGAKEAKAQCNPVLNDVNPFFLNCLANGSPDISVFNFGAGFFNGSGNANVAVGTGNEFNLQAFNTWLGIANDSGNANVVFQGLGGDPNAINIALFNFEAGIANGSGNANVILGDDDTTALN